MPFAVNHDIQIHFELEGAGRPLVLVHQLASNLESWREHGYTHELGGDHQLILVDARGHGQSDKPHEAEDYAAENLADDVAAVLDSLGIAQADYLGYSMGSMMGLALLQKEPERWRSMMLGGIDPCARSTEGESQTASMGRTMLAKAASLGSGQAAVARMESSGRPLSPEVRSMLLSNDPAALVAAIDGMLAWPGVAEHLTAIKVPCLIWAGSADSIHDRARGAAALIPTATFVSLSGLDHAQAGARSDLVLPYLREFLLGLH